MKRVLKVILSLWAVSVAADQGNQEAAGDPNYVRFNWIEGFKAQVAQCCNPGQETGGAGRGAMICRLIFFTVAVR